MDGRARIVIVEDEQIIAADLRRILSDNGYEVLGIAVSGTAAIRLIREQRPDLVLMDIYLIGPMDGIEVARRVRGFLDIPIIYLTSFADPETLERVKSVEPYGYILKPVNEKNLNATIDIALYKHRIQMKLREREEWFFRILSSIGDAVVAVDGTRKVLFMNEAAGRMTGRSESAALGKSVGSVLKLMDENGREWDFSASLKGQDAGPEILPDRRFCLARDKGESFPVDVLASSIPAEGERPSGFVLLLRDMSHQSRLDEARRRTELNLIRSEFLYRYLFEESSIISLIIDKSGIVKEVNKASMLKFGYSKEDLVGKSMLTFVDPAFHKKVAVNLERNFKGIPPIQHTDYYGIFDKQGQLHHVLFSAAKPVPNEQGQADSILITGIDNTDRRAAEEELESSREQLRQLTQHLQQVREQERVGIAREIHDELGQTITALKMDLAWLQRSLNAGGDVKSRIRAMIQLTDTTLQSVKRIAASLRPGLLDDLGLIPAMEWQTHEFQERTGIQCRFLVPGDPFELDRDRSTAIFRIFQETLTNIARHSRATRVTVRLAHRNEQVTLVVKDNGRGITAFEAEHPRSFGIVGIRERVRPWGGEVIFKGRPEKGTTVWVRLRVEGADSNLDRGEDSGRGKGAA